MRFPHLLPAGGSYQPFLSPGVKQDAAAIECLSPLASIMGARPRSRDGKPRHSPKKRARSLAGGDEAEGEPGSPGTHTAIRLLSETASVIGVPVKKITALVQPHLWQGLATTYLAKVDQQHHPRKRLNLKTHKNHGIFVVGPAEQANLSHLYERYGVTDEDVGVLANEPDALTGEVAPGASTGGGLSEAWKTYPRSLDPVAHATGSLYIAPTVRKLRPSGKVSEVPKSPRGRGKPGKCVALAGWAKIAAGRI